MTNGSFKYRNSGIRVPKDDKIKCSAVVLDNLKAFISSDFRILGNYVISEQYVTVPKVILKSWKSKLAKSLKKPKKQISIKRVKMRFFKYIFLVASVSKL